MKWETALGFVSFLYFLVGLIASMIGKPEYAILMCYLIAAICMGFAGVISAIREKGETK